jgi:heme exporter protein D
LGDAMSELLAMGKYGVYIWPAYALAAVVLVGLAWSSVRTLRARERENDALEAERPRRRSRAAEDGR